MTSATTAIGDDLRGRRILVTGASGNIGRSIALHAAEAGAEVVVHYFRDRAGADATCEAVAAAGGTATPVGADLRGPDGASALFDASIVGAAPIDGIVNNAASQAVTPLCSMRASDWRDVLAANLDSAFYVTRAGANAMRSRGIRGAIVNIASIEGMDPAAGHAHYAASKAGLLMFTRAAAQEFGGDGIRVNAVSPGLIDRDGLAADWPDGVGRWLGRAPLGRLGRAADVAQAVLFLLSDRAAFVTGANLVVDGGMSSMARW